MSRLNFRGGGKKSFSSHSLNFVTSFAQTSNENNQMNSEATTQLSIDEQNKIVEDNSIQREHAVSHLVKKYEQKFIPLTIPQADCDIYLCGTLHVAERSVDMVKEAIQLLKPNYVVVELCEQRLDALVEDEEVHQQLQSITLGEVIRRGMKDKSIRTFGIGLLAWLQLRAATTVNSKLGGEINGACKEAYLQKSTVVLGDRLYQITIQRIFDRLTLIEKIRMGFLLSWELISLSFGRISDYIKKTEQDQSFIQDELDRFSELLPSLADVIINERDEYMSRIILDLSRVAFPIRTIDSEKLENRKKGKILVVLGAGHLQGVKKHLLNGSISDARMHEISGSSKHLTTWQGSGIVAIFDVNQFYDKKK